jgi:glyoxylase-like metal-dependent hydrolase (beta-lactamase superfamily II)
MVVEKPERADRMIPLTTGISYLDLEFQGVPRIIATAVLQGPGGVALIDPGPSSTLPKLKAALLAAGISLPDVTAILLTHIHLDHAGATGSILEENPAIRVYVHERGARHMAAPENLVASAARLWGDEMDRLWGEVRPVPADALTALAGSERINAGGRDLDVIYTPGHASHHVSYLCGAAGIAFVGDTGGMKLRPEALVMPPTPPPDIDLEAWRRSAEVIDAWQPDTLFVTHFGPHAPAAPHLAELMENLEVASDLVRRSLGASGTDETREAWFADELRTLLRRRLSNDDAGAYEVAGRFDLSWRGLARYWRKREPTRQPQPASGPPSA